MLTKRKIKSLPDTPGVYFFKRGREILYIGKATSLRDRVRSYLSTEVGESRGSRIVQMVALATKVDFKKTDSVLEALLLEAELIKKHQPKYNVKAKDDKSFWNVVITDEDYPRALMIRNQELQATSYKLKANFGPFPNASELKEALRIIRKIFPFRDSCEPNQGKPCFNYQLGLCPGVCIGAITSVEYKKLVKQIRLLFSGRKQALLRELDKLMRAAARAKEFEVAALWRNRLSALKHLQDISLIKRATEGVTRARIEAYDIAHLGGGSAVGVVVVASAGELSRGDYRKFKVAHGADDLANLREVLERRLAHAEWPSPDLIVVDGSWNQLTTAKNVLTNLNLTIPVVAVVKDERHRAAKLLVPPGTKLAPADRDLILRLNAESHRFAISFHRQRRSKIV